LTSFFVVQYVGADIVLPLEYGGF